MAQFSIPFSTSPHEHRAALEVGRDQRAAMAGKWLQDEPAVVDIGCGLMGLRDYLPATTRYVPVDIVERLPGAAVVDLNKEALPFFGVRTAAMLGVIEYIHDVDTFLPQLRQFGRVVISHNHHSLKDVLCALGLRKKLVGWSHRLTRREFERTGLRIVRRARVRIGEALYEVQPVQP